MATAQATTDHDEIREWVEARGGHPARVKATGRRKDPGILRIDFPGFSGADTLEEISWDEFFEWFDRDRLALLLSDEEGNRFNKFVARGRGSAAKKASSRRVAQSSSKKSASKKSAAKKASSRRVAQSSSKKTSSKKSASKKASSKKASSKKSSSKKASSRGGARASATPAKKASAKSSKKSTSSKKATPAKKSSKKASSKKTSTRRLVASTTRRPSSRSSSSVTTTNHDEIRQWVEARGGFPAHVKRTGRNRKDLGVLRIDYPGYSGRDTLERIDWDDWFQAFEDNDLAFLYQDKKNSRFSKLVAR